jgi:hypothetical protein
VASGGYRIMRSGRMFKRTGWDTKEQAEAALKDFLSRLVNWSSADQDSISDLLGPPPYQFKIADFRCACVYAIIREGELVYVGSSQNGIARPGNGHHLARWFVSNDRVLVWQFDSIAHARKVESDLILKYKPRFNTAGIPGKRQDRQRLTPTRYEQ